MLRFSATNFLALTLFLGCGSSSYSDSKENTGVSTTYNNSTNSEAENIIAEDIYVNCMGCHGKFAEKHALQKSSIISKWDKKEIEKALLDYKYRDRNTYGLGGVMQGQVNGLSDYEIKIISDYVAQFE